MNVGIVVLHVSEGREQGCGLSVRAVSCEHVGSDAGGQAKHHVGEGAQGTLV